MTAREKLSQATRNNNRMAQSKWQRNHRRWLYWSHECDRQTARVAKVYANAIAKAFR